MLCGAADGDGGGPGGGSSHLQMACRVGGRRATAALCAAGEHGRALRGRRGRCSVGRAVRLHRLGRAPGGDAPDFCLLLS